MNDPNRDWHSASQATVIHRPHPPTHDQPVSGQLWAVIRSDACFWLIVSYRLYRGIPRFIGWMSSHE